MARITEGQPAPDFTLTAHDGSAVSMADLRGTTVVLYFYPKDDTKGCTAQACTFRDARDRYDERGVRVVGISPDPVSSHARFREKHSLDFTLLSDPEHRVAEAYGVWVEKSMYGRRSMGIERSTFVIDGDGVVRRALYRVRAPGHADAVLELLDETS